ncbi:hypothetical protein P376_1050 [Streptomyces sp. HCCB10043]|nr:hypothetical protein P376_1050 [Streptomyces sp. HCCB10043]
MRGTGWAPALPAASGRHCANAHAAPCERIIRGTRGSATTRVERLVGTLSLLCFPTESTVTFAAKPAGSRQRAWKCR